jgi:hypothetical protein
VVKDVCEIGVVVLSTRNVPTDLIHYSDIPPMPKRRATSDEDDEAHQSASEEETVKKSKKTPAKSEKKAKATTLMRVTADFPTYSRLQAQPSKKQKKGKESAGADGGVKTNEEGDKYVELGRNRRATVRVFKGTSFRLDAVRLSRNDADHHLGIPLIDIREYFDSGGEPKPGKKGISLKLEEVNKFSIAPIIAVLMIGSVAGAQAECGCSRWNLVRC